MTLQGERLDRFVAASVIFHVALFSVAILSPKLFPNLGSNWGSPTGGSGGISVKIVGNVSGVALPTPPVVNETAAANESPGLYKSEETAPPPPPPPDKPAELIP